MVCVCVRIYHNQTPLTIWENRIYDIYVLVLLLLRLHVKEKNLDKIGGCSGCRLRKTLSACNWVQETWTMTYMTLRKSVGVGRSATCKLETVKMMAFLPISSAGLMQILHLSCLDYLSTWQHLPVLWKALGSGQHFWARDSPPGVALVPVTRMKPASKKSSPGIALKYDD